MINPQEVIEKYSIKDLCESADDYYKSIANPWPQMAKPFSSVVEAPELLINMGQLLSGLKLGKTMRVLEFGAGACWFSRFLSQMQCATVACDTSATAIGIGKRLFHEYPIIGDYVAAPEFLVFDGHRIDLPDESVDRIICFDTFHHIPNQEEVLAEFFRVLRDGGIAGFSEPGRYHSRSPQSQYEMANFKVLENDVDLDGIFKLANRIGFEQCQATIVNAGKTVFFIHKGVAMPDSRGHEGLAYAMKAERTSYKVGRSEQLVIDVDILNSGGAKWLCKNFGDLGVVKLGAHLYDANRNLLNLDFARSCFARDVLPGESVSNAITVTFPHAGKFYLSLDLVSESICWFENVGATPAQIEVTVQ
ncbi:MAG TPA: class I SAM-dependent methyltransferase [Noviherbaspirillum sp.]|uniref:class I SAM-dependent methyltransferase n=1 Tax=Noviherbaspirillum sp. TaxID=1926288 RepID=UPI002B48F882|nr:class I SAM-dependent methyltransferase [Noviherbaspirillum sp.]HJV87709.1 class I SAM-dependent methyltransferase [Noviherbaspirillum sp.]